MAQGLEEHPFAAGLTVRQVKSLQRLAQTERFEPGDYLIREGRPADRFYLLVDGMVSIELQAPDGLVRIQTESGGGEVGYSWLFAPHRYAFDVRALEATIAVRIQAVKFRELMEKDTELGYQALTKLLETMAGRLAQSRLQVLDMHSRGPQRG